MNAVLPIEPTTQKQAFAEVLLRRLDGDAYQAALVVLGGDIAGALIASREWPADPEVLAVRATYTPEELDELSTPTDNDLIREAWRRVQDSRTHEIAFKGIETIVKIRHKGGTGGTTINNNTLVDNRSVMIVKDHGTDAEWEAALLAQQAKLVHDAT